ncbi:MAG TPA: hypothetical protein VFZ34_24960 [Blastocatellia bacterium]|nr:hypothetical protein [Blastocatellia bacterium]
MKRTAMVISILMLILLWTPTSTARDRLRIAAVTPRFAHPGDVLTLVGEFGENAQGKVVYLNRIVNHQAIRTRLEILAPWEARNIRVVIPAQIPPDRYLVIVTYDDRPTLYSNTKVVTIVPADVALPPIPVPPVTRTGEGEVIMNPCGARHGRVVRQTDDGYERSSGGLYPACETMRHITGADLREAYPGGRISLSGDFGSRQSAQVVALLRAEASPPDLRGRQAQRIFVQHLLQIEQWSPGRIVVRIHNLIRPGAYPLVILNRQPEAATTPLGRFEVGSNLMHIQIRP